MKYEIYIDRVGEWRWEFIAANGKTIGVSSEGYRNKNDCLHSITLMKSSYNAPVYER